MKRFVSLERLCRYNNWFKVWISPIKRDDTSQDVARANPNRARVWSLSQGHSFSSIGYWALDKRCCATSQKNSKETIMDFSTAKLEDSQRSSYYHDICWKRQSGVQPSSDHLLGENQDSGQLQVPQRKTPSQLEKSPSLHSGYCLLATPGNAHTGISGDQWGNGGQLRAIRT